MDQCQIPDRITIKGELKDVNPIVGGTRLTFRKGKLRQMQRNKAPPQTRISTDKPSQESH